MLAREKEAAIEEFGIVCGDEEVPDFGTRGFCDLTENLGSDRDGTLGKYFYILLEEGGLNLSALLGIVFGQEHNRNAELAALVEPEAALLQEPVARNSRSDSDAIRGFSVRGNCSAMFEASECRKGMLEDLVRRLRRELRDKADPAGVEVETRVYQASLKVGRH